MLPEFDAETINAKYKGVSGEPMTPSGVTAWEKIRELASRFQRADRIVMGVPMWNFSSRFSSESALRPFQYGIRGRGGTIFAAASRIRNSSPNREAW
jgi:Flavodoxin-like fold